MPVLTENRQAALAQDDGPALTAGRETDVAKRLPIYENNVQPHCMNCILLVFVCDVNNLMATILSILYKITQYIKSRPLQIWRPLWRHKFVCRCWQHSRTERYAVAVTLCTCIGKVCHSNVRQRLFRKLCKVFLTTFHV